MQRRDREAWRSISRSTLRRSLRPQAGADRRRPHAMGHPNPASDTARPTLYL